MHLFEQVSMETLERQLEHCEKINLVTDEILLKPKYKNTSLFIILSGTLNVYLEEVDTPITILNVGDCAGELSILSDINVSALVIAAEPCHLLKIRQETLWSMINASHILAKNLLFILSRRIHNDNSRLLEYIELQKKFKKFALLDALTGLHNRHWLNDVLPRQILRHQKNQAYFSLLMIDIDHFKEFNDSHGHLAGDLALSTLADTFRKHLRPLDHAARFGGEEFIIIFEAVRAKEAFLIAERLRKDVKKLEITYEDKILNITISIGITESNTHQTMNELLKIADKALYQAKENGRDCTILATPE